MNYQPTRLANWAGMTAEEEHGANSAPEEQSLFNPNPINSSDAVLERVRHAVAGPAVETQSEASNIFTSSATIAAHTNFKGQDLKKRLDDAILQVAPLNERTLTVSTALQEWEGRVVWVGSEKFTAALVDVTAESQQELEEADFDLEDVFKGDLDLLQEGAIFRWVIGYRKSGGTKERFSRIVFRRLPAWSKKDIEAIEKEAIELTAAISRD